MAKQTAAPKTRKTAEVVPDFWAPLTAEGLARQQGVGPIRSIDDMPKASDPDPAEAEWFDREVRKLRNRGR